MSDPIRAIQSLPWADIVPVAALTTVLAVVGDRCILWLAQQVTGVAVALQFLANFGPLLAVLVGSGVGLLALYLAQRLYPSVRGQLGSLWSVVFLTLVGLWLAGQIIPPLLLVADFSLFLGIAIGIFWGDRIVARS
ncbi:MAG: hypothetical protein Fur0042_00780 [Cyanophyceae cyanobacterium]